MKVGFLVAGAQKSGTTAMDAALRLHSSLTLPAKKELHFFDNEKHFAAGHPNYAAYHANFGSLAVSQLAGEATPIYMYWYSAPKRIFDYNPAMKWIILLRNPVERAYSHWNMERARQREDLDFRDALAAEPARRSAAFPLQNRVHSYVDRGFYLQQLERVWRFFPKNQVLVLKHEEFRDYPAQVLERVARFLGIVPFPPGLAKRVYTGTYPAPMAAADRAYLENVFADEIRSLEQRLGWDLAVWRGQPVP